MEVSASVESGEGGMVQRDVNVLSVDASNGASVLRGGAFPALPPSSSSSASPSEAIGIQALVPLYSILHSQVMTEEQLETLRRQISVYATICQQLVEMHKAVMAQQSTIQGLHLGQPMPFDAVLHSGHKLTARQRWTPSQTQLQILERLFEQGNGTPSKQKIKEITLELSHHGQISETNVYNWFQNRRARTKRKQQVGGFNNGESELDTDGDSPEEKKNKAERDLPNENITGAYGETNFQGWNTNECCPFEGPRGFLQSSQATKTDSSGADFKCHTIHIHDHNLPEGAFSEDHKPWDATMIDRKPDCSVGPSVSQNSQGRILILNGAGQSMKLLHTTKGFNISP